jgi:hypothetical protein
MIDADDINWQAVLDCIKAKTHFFPVPDDRFDPRYALEGQLRYYGLPPKPSDEAPLVRRAFWDKMFTPPAGKARVTFVDPRTDFTYEPIEKTTQPPGQRVFAGTNQETSLNWSGAYVTSFGGRMITEVHGSWDVPWVKPPPGQDLGAPDWPKRFRCSTWLGLDGQRRYFNASLPQIGTSQFVKVTGNGGDMFTTEPAVWWQWWLRDAQNPLPIRLPLPVKACDEVMASLFVVDATHVTLLIANHSQGIVCTPFMEPEPTLYLPAPVQAGPVRVSGATAEWVTERPTNWVTKELFELPDYGTVLFRDCHVVTGPAPNLDARVEEPHGARLMNMYRRADYPDQAVTVSVARRSGRHDFTTSYLGAARE